jgi:hypothetical protein
MIVIWLEFSPSGITKVKYRSLAAFFASPQGKNTAMKLACAGSSEDRPGFL